MTPARARCWCRRNKRGSLSGRGELRAFTLIERAFFSRFRPRIVAFPLQSSVDCRRYLYPGGSTETRNDNITVVNGMQRERLTLTLFA